MLGGAGPGVVTLAWLRAAGRAGCERRVVPGEVIRCAARAARHRVAGCRVRRSVSTRRDGAWAFAMVSNAVLPTFRVIMSNRTGTCGCGGRLVRKTEIPCRRSPKTACLLPSAGDHYDQKLLRNVTTNLGARARVSAYVLYQVHDGRQSIVGVCLCCLGVTILPQFGMVNAGSYPLPQRSS